MNLLVTKKFLSKCDVFLFILVIFKNLCALCATQKWGGPGVKYDAINGF